MRRILAALAAVVLIAALVLLVLLLAEALGEVGVSNERWTTLGALVGAVAGGLLALVAWLLAERRADERDEDRRAERRTREGAVAAARAEREANAQLRRQVSELAGRQGALGDWDDVRALVLRMAMTITDAGKGLLLTRSDDADGRLELAVHEGFETDPRPSRLARRFAREVLEHDRTIREDEPPHEGEPADREIANLLAIPIYVADEFSGVVVCANREGGFGELDDDVLLALGDHAGAVLQNAGLHAELRGSYLSTVQMLAEAIQAKDPFLRGHSEEVSDYVAAVARRLDLDGQRREELVFGSLLHDLGKIGVSERILHKPAALTAEEFAIIQLHPRIGHRLIEQVPLLKPIAAAILHHHERFDGGGYPAGLKGEQIPLEARIVCVADAFSAMTADRPYRSRVPQEEACAELERNAGTQFDPEVVRVFVEEVRGRPPGRADSVLSEALDDLQLQMHRSPGEPVLGAGALALTDALTLLYTHRYVHEAAAAEAERCRLHGGTFTVVLAALDEVPLINREQGFAAGDGHLRGAARALSRLAVRFGATAARENGIVLALLVPRDRSAGAVALAAEVAGALRDFGAVRVGSAEWRGGDDGEMVLARARAALAAAMLPEP